MKNIETFFKLVRNLFFSTFALIFMFINSASANIDVLQLDKNNPTDSKVVTITSQSIQTLSPEDALKVFKPLLCDINRAKSSPSIFLKKLDCYVSERNFPLLRKVIPELNPEQIRAILPDIVDGKDKLESNVSTIFSQNIKPWNVSFIDDSLLSLFSNYSTEVKQKNLMIDFFNSNDVLFYKNEDGKILFRLDSYASSLVKFLEFLKDNNATPINVEDYTYLLDAFAKQYMGNVNNRDEGIVNIDGFIKVNSIVILSLVRNSISNLEAHLVANHLKDINEGGWQQFYITRCLDTVVNTTEKTITLLTFPIFITTEINQLLNPVIPAVIIADNTNNNVNTGGELVSYGLAPSDPPLPLTLPQNPFLHHPLTQPTQYNLCIGAGYHYVSCGLDPSDLK